MRLEDLDFDLPPSRIAQRPAVPRDSAKLLVCRGGGRLGAREAPLALEDAVFSDLASEAAPWALGARDLLVTNDAKVLPVRLLGHRETGQGPGGGEVGGAVEALLLRREGPCEWSALMHISARVRPGLRVVFEPGVVAEVLSTHEERLKNEGEVRLRFGGLALDGPGAEPEGRFERWLERHGHVPLPPYIERPDSESDKRDYQTVYATKSGSAAAPTAGFHFTPELLARLGERGVKHAHVTLHVGLGTFRPIKVDRVEEHIMHEERFEISEEFVRALRDARKEGRRVVAVGTTVVRALESWAARLAEGGVEPEADEAAGAYSTRAFILPGTRFRVVDDLLTNFHLPRSTLLALLAGAMEPGGVVAMREAYAHALAREYRFFSYGDAMFIRGGHA